MKNRQDLSITYWATLGNTARDLIARQPVSISESSTAREAATFLINAGLHAAPVINDAGRPVGVLSRTDIVRHYMDQKNDLAPCSYQEQEAILSRRWLLPNGRSYKNRLAEFDLVRDIMTPVIITVRGDASIEQVLFKFVGFELLHLFVVDEAGVLVGVISALDILRSLCRCPS
jgi:CBS domain-containing protein